MEVGSGGGGGDDDVADDQREHQNWRDHDHIRSQRRILPIFLRGPAIRGQRPVRGVQKNSV